MEWVTMQHELLDCIASEGLQHSFVAINKKPLNRSSPCLNCMWKNLWNIGKQHLKILNMDDKKKSQWW